MNYFGMLQVTYAGTIDIFETKVKTRQLAGFLEIILVTFRSAPLLRTCLTLALGIVFFYPITTRTTANSNSFWIEHSHKIQSLG